MRGRLSSKATVEGDIYRSGGGGGSTVEITPVYNTGTKIADYTIDGEEGTIYIPNGIYDVLWTNGGTTNPSSISLSHNLNDYDFVLFNVNRDSYGQRWKLQFPICLKYGYNLLDQILLFCWSNNNEYISYDINAWNELNGLQQGNALILTSIIGVKL